MKNSSLDVYHCVNTPSPCIRPLFPPPVVVSVAPFGSTSTTRPPCPSTVCDAPAGNTNMKSSTFEVYHCDNTPSPCIRPLFPTPVLVSIAPFGSTSTTRPPCPSTVCDAPAGNTNMKSSTLDVYHCVNTPSPCICRFFIPPPPQC